MSAVLLAELKRVFNPLVTVRREECGLDIIQTDPFQNPPPYEKLVGDLEGAYSRRINIQHRLVYEVIESENTVKILRMWTHYE
ncbi:MAG: Txe/YoeB family addiction module toxin [Leptolyngbya sp.]|nr:MAG: Txe/YoeB family addiction module toxin [Leptolyngbya sp.]